jgi:cytochrome P450
MEAAILLATIAQRFQLRTLPGHPVIAVPSFTLRPKNGIRMRIERRQAVLDEATEIFGSARN